VKRHAAETLPVRIKPFLMRAYQPVWKHVLYPPWLRWYRWRIDARWLWRYGSYEAGDVVWWRGVRLVCCHSHYAGPHADHPWDPGVCWPACKRNAMWEPKTPRDRLLLRFIGDPRVSGRDAR
jgi:hypothetical protein